MTSGGYSVLARLVSGGLLLGWVAMSYPPEPVASARRCTVTGRNNGGPCSIVAEELPDLTTVVLYPHGVNSYGVVLDRDEQEVLGQWLLTRGRTPRRGHASEASAAS